MCPSAALALAVYGLIREGNVHIGRNLGPTRLVDMPDPGCGFA